MPRQQEPRRAALVPGFQLPEPRASARGARAGADRTAIPSLHEPATEHASSGSSSTSSPTSSSSAGLARTHCRRTARTCSSSARFWPSEAADAEERRPRDVSEFLTALAGGDGGVAARDGDDPAQGGLPALLLPAPAAGGDARFGPDRGALDTPQRGQKLPKRARAVRGPAAARAAEGNGSDRPARPRTARTDVRLRAAHVGGDRRSRCRHVDLEARHCAGAGKGSKERIVPVGRTPCGRSRLSAQGRPALVGERERAAPVRQLPRRAADPPGPVQDRSTARRLRRSRRADEPAHAAPHVRDAPARGRL